MTRTPFIFAIAAITALPCSAQKLTVVIDAARGGSEYGARIDGRTYEKQVTLDLANRLRSLLSARDFNVVLTRESDTLVTNEQRAAVANQNKPIACLLLHATAAGHGLHVWTSSLSAMPVGSTAVLWDLAQAPYVQRSQRLASEFAAAFSRSRVAVSSGQTWIRPLDNMECPAVALELAPEDSGTPSSDRKYQARIADAIASQMLFWRGHTDVVQSVLNPPPPPAPVKPAAAAPASDAATAPVRHRAPSTDTPVQPPAASPAAGSAATPRQRVAKPAPAEAEPQ